MKRYILKRLLFAVPTILGSMMVVFLIIRSIPGDPVAMKFGKSATVQEIEEYREEYGYNRPMAVQMVDSIIDTFRGDLGYSMANNQPVFDMILDCLPNTLELTIFGVLLAIVLGVTSGIFAALYRGQHLRHDDIEPEYASDVDALVFLGASAYYCIRSSA